MGNRNSGGVNHTGMVATYFVALRAYEGRLDECLRRGLRVAAVSSPANGVGADNMEHQTRRLDAASREMQRALDCAS